MHVVEEILRIDISPRMRLGLLLFWSLAFSASSCVTAYIMSALVDVPVPLWAHLLCVLVGIALALISYRSYLNYRRGRIKEMCEAVAADAFQCSRDGEADLVVICHHNCIKIGSQSVEDEREIIRFTPREFADVAAVLERRAGSGEPPAGRSLFDTRPEDSQ